jgi:hypothetical protein
MSISAQNSKVIPLLGPATVATNATGSNYFDRRGFNYARVDVTLPPATATNSSAKFIALALSEGDTTSSFSAFGNFTGTTNSTAASTEFVLPVQNNTSVGAVHSFFINLPPRKRYIKVALTPPASHTTVYAQVILSRAEIAPDTDTERGVAVSVIG